MRALINFMVIGTAAIALLLALMYFLQSRLILLPGTVGGGADVLAQCASGSAEWLEEGEYRGKICEPASPAEGTVIVYHGNAGTVDDRGALAAPLSARGFRVVLVEYPGYGKRAGRASIKNVLAASLDDFVMAQARWPGPIYVLGESFGTGIAAAVARRSREKVAGLVLITPWDSLANVVDAMFFAPLSFLLHERFDTVEALSGYRGNVVIVAAEQDEVLPVAHARALAKAAPAATYLELRDASHNNWPSYMMSKDWNRVIESLVNRPPSFSKAIIQSLT